MDYLELYETIDRLYAALNESIDSYENGDLSREILLEETITAVRSCVYYTD